MKLLILETESLVEAYGCLDRFSKLGHVPLEFSPNAQGARVLFKAQTDAAVPARSDLSVCELSESILKAYLSLSDAKLAEKMLVVESQKLADLLNLAQVLENQGMKILEVRSFKANPKINYAIGTFDSKALEVNSIASLLQPFKHVVLDSNSSALRDFLGFNV